MQYPARFTRDKVVGGFVVSFPDVPEAITEGETIEEAMSMASEALELALTFYTEKWRDAPQAKYNQAWDAHGVGSGAERSEVRTLLSSSRGRTKKD